MIETILGYVMTLSIMAFFVSLVALKTAPNRWITTLETDSKLVKEIMKVGGRYHSPHWNWLNKFGRILYITKIVAPCVTLITLFALWLIQNKG